MDDLYEALIHGNTSDIEYLHEKIDQVTKEDGATILHLAIDLGRTECIRLILTEFTNKHLLIKVDKYKKTALHWAAERGKTDAVELLINAARGLPSSVSEDPDNTLLSSGFKEFIREDDVNGDTALHLAVKNKKVNVVKLLVNADPTHEHSLNRKFETPLYLAADRGYKDLLQNVSEQKFDGPPVPRKVLQQSVIRVVAAGSRKYNDIVKVICDSCINPSFDGPEGRTALHAAVENRDIDCVRIILDKRGDLVLKRDDGGRTALDYAASDNIVSLLDILVQTENNQFHDYSEYKHLFMNRHHEETALHLAAYYGHTSTVLQLMKLYPDFVWCAGDVRGRNILHIAVNRRHRELVQGIQQYCPDLSLILNTKDEEGNTPLHLLVMRGCFIPELIKHERVDRNAKNNDNFTPYDLLYLDEEIVEDQLKIKEALEDSEFINQRWNFGLRKSNQELVTAESPVFPSMRYTKDAKFKIARDLLIKEEINLYRARINTQIIVTALITTVTFTVGFTMPGGYHQSGETDEGSALLSKKTAFNVFMLADTLALLLSMSSLALYFVASMYQDAEEISKLVDASTLLNIVSVVATTLTFVVGICLVLSHSSVLVISVSVMSGFFFLLIILLMIKVIKDPIEKFRE